MTLYRVSAQSVEVLTATANAPTRVSAESLEVLYTAGYVSGTVPGWIYQVNCGSDVSATLFNWNNIVTTAAQTVSNLRTSTYDATTVGITSPTWDIAQTDGVAHADLPAAVSASYLKWFASARVLTITGLSLSKTYTLVLYSTAPGSVTVNWTVGASTQGLARGGKVTWTGVTPDSSGTITITSAATTSGTDATLSAVILTEEQTRNAPGLFTRSTAQAIEVLHNTYDIRIAKAWGYVITGVGPGPSIMKAAGYAVIDDGSMATYDNYWYQVVLLLHCDGSNGGTTFVDSSPAPKTVTANGNAQLSTAQFKFGTTAALFDGTGDYLETPDSPDWNFGTGSFTVEGWFRFTTVNSNIALMGQWETGVAADSSWYFWRNSGNLGFRIMTAASGTVDVQASWTPTANTWYHLAADRDAANVLRIYVNGAIFTSATSTQDIRDVATAFRIGRISSSFNSYDMAGYADDVRVTKGAARYAATVGFSPNIVAYPDTGYSGVATRRRTITAICG